MDNHEEQLLEVKTKVYKKRWFVVALLGWLMFLYVFTYINFGYLNNVMVSYFDTTYAAIDWMVLSCNVGTILASIVVACFALSNVLSCKKAMISASILFTIGFTFIIVGFLRPCLYFLITLGQVFNGFGGALIFALPGSIAQLWFDESQIGIATGMALLGSSTASITANILPPQLLKIFQRDSKIQQSVKNISYAANETWIQNVKRIYVSTYFIMLLIVVIISILLCALVPEKPKLAPSMAQYRKRSQKHHTGFKLQDIAYQIKTLCCDHMFIVGNVSATLVYYLAAFDDLFVELVVSKLFLNFTKYTPEEISGFFVATVSIGCVVTNIFFGMFLDRFKNYYWQSNIAAILVLITSVTTLLSVHFQNLLGLCLSYFFTGLSKRACYLSLIDSLLQHTYPLNPLFVMSVAGFLQNITALVFVNIGRQIIYKTSITGGLIYVCVVMFFLCILCSFFIPVTNRLKANKCQLEDERISLLSTQTSSTP